MASIDAPGSLAPKLEEWLIQLKLMLFNIGLLLLLALPATAQTIDESESEFAEAEIEKEEAIEADTDGSLDDTMNSIDVRDEQDGIGLSADFRVGYFQWEIEDSDATSQTEDFAGSRWRFSRTCSMSSSGACGRASTTWAISCSTWPVRSCYFPC